MSQENVEVFGRLLDAFNARDLDGFVDECDPEIELHSRFTAVGGVYRGEIGLRRWHGDLGDAWDYLQLQLDRVIDVDDDTILVLMTLTGKDAVAASRSVRKSLISIPSARARWLESSPDRAEAFAAAGLRE
jgi:hypothetical protein